MVRKFPAIQIQSLTRLLYDKGKDKRAKNKSTIQDYSANLRYGNVGFYWDPAGRWLRAHGDGKSTSGGKFFTETMKTSGDKPVYSVSHARRSRGTQVRDAWRGPAKRR